MKKILIIEADTNDGDYITSKHEVTDEQLEKIQPMIEAIKNFKPYKGKATGTYKTEHNHDNNYPVGDCCRENLGQISAEDYYTKIVTPEQFEEFDNLTPYGEYGIHTIESITVLEVVKEHKLL